MRLKSEKNLFYFKKQSLKKPFYTIIFILFYCITTITYVIAQTPGAPICQPTDQLPCYCMEKDAQIQQACFPGDVTYVAPNAFNTFSWQSFVALNWPVKQGSNGAPDLNKKIDDSFESFPVWETWKNDYEIYLASGKRPKGWNDQGRMLPRVCSKLKLKSTSNIPIGKPRLLYKFLDPQNDALVDQNGNLVRNEILMNKVAFDYLVQYELYDKNSQTLILSTDFEIEFPKGTRPPLPVKRGAIILKAAWKILEDELLYDQFHKSWAYIYNLPAHIHKKSTKGKGYYIKESCQLKIVGLVGFHLIYKTNAAPGWAWATFEQENNTPFKGNESDLKKKWTFYNPDSTITVNTPPQFSYGAIPGLKYQPSGKIVRENQIQNPNLNLMPKILSNTVWEHYILIGTQWLQPSSPPFNRNNNTPFKDIEKNIVAPNLANTTLETYVQNEASCMECHYNAKIGNEKPTDFLFGLSNAAPRIDFIETKP